jgi:hypothetical protein
MVVPVVKMVTGLPAAVDVEGGALANVKGGGAGARITEGRGGAEDGRVPPLTLTLPGEVLFAVRTTGPLPAVVEEPVVPETKELMVKALAGVEPFEMMMTSDASAPSWLPVIVAAPVLLSKSTPPVVLVQRPPRVIVWAPASLRELTDWAAVVVTSAVLR